jgi:ketosteroid isomerase-like protein
VHDHESVPLDAATGRALTDLSPSPPVEGHGNNPNKDDSTNTDVVRAALNAYLAQDHAVAEQPLADDFVFTSPQDDHIGKAAYLDRCFPTADRLVSQQLLQLVDAGNGGVFVLYEYELKVGGRYRNAEFITVRGGQLIESQVFFGGRTS